jgi:hypothetical protein
MTIDDELVLPSGRCSPRVCFAESVCLSEKSRLKILFVNVL